MKRYIAILKTANGTMPMKVRAKKESEVEGKLKKFKYESILKILNLDEYNKTKHKHIVVDRLY